MISKIVERIQPSGIREFFDLVLGMPDVISLGVGEPDFVAPWRIRERAITALEEGYTSYTSNKGLKILRQSISEHLYSKYALRYDPEDEILITVGVSEAYDLATRAIIDPKDKVIVVSPHYVAYPALVEINLGRVLYLPTYQKDGFKIKLSALKALVTQKPKAIVLNYPSNPTGVTYTRVELERIWNVLGRAGVIPICDEVYDEITYQGKHVPLASLKGAKEKTVLLNGFSKGYAMTGFRIGYVCGPKLLISAMTKIHAFSMLCAPIVSQLAATEALKAMKEVESMRKQYLRRRDFIVKELNNIGLVTTCPQGAFYCFSSVEKLKMPALDFAKRLLFEEKVAVVPGTAFGSEYGSFVRISYANTLDNLKEALIRIERFIQKLR